MSEFASTVNWVPITEHFYYDQYKDSEVGGLEQFGSHFVMLPDGATLFGDLENDIIRPSIAFRVCSV